jgi:hypothetical protein
VDPTIDEPVIPIVFNDLEVPLAPEVDNSDEDDVGTLRAHYLAKNATDLDAERVLVAALKGMSGLTSFRWSRTPPLINADQEDDIWITIAKCCPSLNTINVISREKPCAGRDR